MPGPGMTNVFQAAPAFNVLSKELPCVGGGGMGFEPHVVVD